MSDDTFTFAITLPADMVSKIEDSLNNLAARDQLLGADLPPIDRDQLIECAVRDWYADREDDYEWLHGFFRGRETPRRQSREAITKALSEQAKHNITRHANTKVTPALCSECPHLSDELARLWEREGRR